MPGVRRLRSVTAMLRAKSTRPSVASPAPVIHASTPLLARNVSLESGGSGLTPASEGVNSRLAYSVTAPAT